jgi:hypothetical protein
MLFRTAQTQMQPQRLAALAPTRLSASRALVHRMSRERWNIEIVRFDIDERARGEAVYRIRTPTMTFSFIAFSFEPTLEGRTGRIIGESWDQMGALVEGEVSQADVDQTRRELPKLYAGRATPGSLVWCRSNRSVRLFEHVVERLAEGRQPEVDEIWRVGYLMRNTGLDGNGTFGTRSFGALGEDHPLSAPLHAQMLAAYLMREFSVDLAEHLARCASSTAVPLDPELRRCVGLGNGSGFGLLFFVNVHPFLVDRWLTARNEAVETARGVVLSTGSAEVRRLLELLRRASTFYAQDPFVYYSFTPASAVAADLQILVSQIEDMVSRGPMRAGEVVDRVSTGVSVDAVEVLNAMLLEMRPDETDRYLPAGFIDETLRRRPEASVGELLELLRREYAWTDDFPMDDPRQRKYRWYKSEAAEEPRRGLADEVAGGVEWALDIPGDIQRLRSRLEQVSSDTKVGHFLFEFPEERATVQRVQGLAGRALHSPHMNMLGEDLRPAHVIRLMNSAFHGLDKTSDLDGRWGLWGLIFHGAPTRHDIADGRANDWIYPQRPEQRG